METGLHMMEKKGKEWNGKVCEGELKEKRLEV